jgi:hypothetical protein
MPSDETGMHGGDHGRGADAVASPSRVMVWANCRAWTEIGHERPLPTPCARARYAQLVHFSFLILIGCFATLEP